MIRLTHLIVVGFLASPVYANEPKQKAQEPQQTPAEQIQKKETPKVKPAEEKVKPTVAKPVAEKPAEQKPAEQVQKKETPVVAKPAEVKPAEQKPAEQVQKQSEQKVKATELVKQGHKQQEGVYGPNSFDCLKDGFWRMTAKLADQLEGAYDDLEEIADNNKCSDIVGLSLASEAAAERVEKYLEHACRGFTFAYYNNEVLMGLHSDLMSRHATLSESLRISEFAGEMSHIDSLLLDLDNRISQIVGAE